MSNKVEVVTERNFSAHHMLLRAARAALEDAEDSSPSKFNSQLMAMTLAALAIEAITNTFGSRVIENWHDFDALNPNSKLRIICEKLEIEYDKNKEPWSTAKLLYGFRNNIVHAKPESIKIIQVFTEDENERRENSHPKSKLEGQISLGLAKRAVTQVNAIKDVLCQKISPEESLGLWNDGWFSTTTQCKEN